MGRGASTVLLRCLLSLGNTGLCRRCSIGAILPKHSMTFTSAQLKAFTTLVLTSPRFSNFSSLRPREDYFMI